MGRPIYDYRTSGKQAWKDLKRDNIFLHKKVKNYSTFKKVIYEVNRNVHTYILTSGLFTELPYGFGHLGIVKTQQKIKNKEGKTKLSIDWKKTKEQKKICYHLNSHTNGHKIKYYWNSMNSKMLFSYAYKVVECRKSARDIASFIFDENNVLKDSLYIYNPTIQWLENLKESKVQQDMEQNIKT